MAATDDVDEVLERFKLSRQRVHEGEPKARAEPVLPSRRRYPRQPLWSSRAWMGTGRRDPGAWRIVLSRWRDLRLRDGGQVRDPRACLHLVDRADRREG